MDAMDSTDLQAPCNCGALGDHPRTSDCSHFPVVEIEVTGSRSACLEAVGFLRTGYYATINHEWQNPESGQWVFRIGAVRSYWQLEPHPVPMELTGPAADAAVLAYLDDAMGLEVPEAEIRAITNLDDATLASSLAALVEAGGIEHVRPGYYRKNL